MATARWSASMEMQAMSFQVEASRDIIRDVFAWCVCLVEFDVPDISTSFLKSYNYRLLSEL